MRARLAAMTALKLGAVATAYCWPAIVCCFFVRLKTQHFRSVVSLESNSWFRAGVHRQGVVSARFPQLAIRQGVGPTSRQNEGRLVKITFQPVISK